MEELSTKQQKFYSHWEERRKKKWVYIFLHGSVYWGLFMAISMFLWKSDFEFEKMQFSNLIIAILVFGISGIFVGLNNFKQIDKVYMKLNDESDVLLGIEELKERKVWKYENLIIRNENNEALVVRNKLFWFESSDISEEKLNDCLNIVLSDIQRLKKNEKFKDFSKSYKTTIQIFDNTESRVPLLEKSIAI